MSVFTGKGVVTITPLRELETDTKQANILLFRILLALSAKRLGQGNRLTSRTL